jgi:hypothetical protein
MPDLFVGVSVALSEVDWRLRVKWVRCEVPLGVCRVCFAVGV